jgi:hypothetical protein
MTTYTDTDLRQRPDAVLNDAQNQGEVRIKRGDGKEFVLRPAEADRSGLDVPGIKTNITTEEIVAAVRQGRERDYPHL